jgi:hypothetical protein
MQTILCNGCLGKPDPSASRTSASVALPGSNIIAAAARSGTVSKSHTFRPNGIYLGYEALDPGCSDRELDLFITKEEEPYCGMCSATRRPLFLTMPIQSRQSPHVTSSPEPIRPG